MNIARASIVSVLLAAAAFAQTTTPANAPPSNPAEEAAVRAALAKYNDAINAGDVPALISSITTASDLQKQALGVMGNLTTASGKLFKATSDKFGAEALAQGNIVREAFPGGFPPLPVEQLKIRVEGDKATMTAGEEEQPVPLTLIKSEGVWKLNGGELLPPFTEQQLKDQTAIINAAIGAMDQTAQDVTAGHFRSPDEVPVLMQHRVQKAIQAAQMKLLPPDMGNPEAAPSTAPAGPAMP